MSCDKKVVFFRQFSATRKEMPENNAFLNKNSQGKIFLWLFLSADKRLMQTWTSKSLSVHH